MRARVGRIPHGTRRILGRTLEFSAGGPTDHRRREEALMSEHRTTASGHRAFGTGFTMITGVGGAPVDRSTADRMCRGLETDDHRGPASSTTVADTSTNER